MRIRAKLCEMAASEIAAMISPEKLAEIKAKDRTPIFKAFVVGHEGEASGRIVGIGNLVKRWFRAMVKKLYDKINIGLQVFLGHASTNDTTGRMPIGEVVGKSLKKIKDKISVIVACYIYPEYRHLPLDVASIEANVELDDGPKKAGADLYVADVNEVTAIALGNSQVETPGFPGATLLGQLQAFVNKKIKENKMDLTIEEIKEILKAEKIKPSDLYGAEELAGDPAVKGLIKSEVKEAVTGEYAHRKRTEEAFDKVRKELEEKLRERDEKISRMALESAKAQTAALFQRERENRKLTEKQAAYIEARLPNFSPQKIENLEGEFGQFLDNQLDQFAKDAKVFGLDAKRPGQETGDTGAAPAKNDDGDRDDKYLNPETNPFIKIA